jgi:hypothetical protein
MSNRMASPDLSSDTPMDGAFGVDIATGASATVVKAANRQRIVLFLTNASDTAMYIGLGENPVSDAGVETGIYLAANGGSLVIDNWTGVVSAIHEGAAAKRITGSEV